MELKRKQEEEDRQKRKEEEKVIQVWTSCSVKFLLLNTVKILMNSTIDIDKY